MSSVRMLTSTLSLCVVLTNTDIPSQGEFLQSVGRAEVKRIRMGAKHQAVVPAVSVWRVV
jgi:hypothetical protein